MKSAILAAVAAALCACSTAGPFVTNISSNGAGALNVDKCTVELNGFTGTVSNKDCTSTTIQVTGAATAVR